MEPNKEAMQLWANALRSGEYAQGNGVLARADHDGVVRYCCLGVLCEVAISAGLDIQVKNTGGTRFFDDAELMPPESVNDWAGFATDSDYQVPIPDGFDPEEGSVFENFEGQSAVELAALNDAHAYTFDQIAEQIENNYL